MSSSNPTLNCSTSHNTTLQANPDIAGIGVLLGFATSSYATLVLCTTYYLVDRQKVQNRVDRLCIDAISGLLCRLAREPSVKYLDALEDAVLAFSDLQVVTGIAILTSGYTQLHSGLAAYHWQLVVDLAWFSAITHLTTLTCLRHYFQRRKILRSLRLIFIGITAVMLGTALASTGYWNNLDADLKLGYPARCFFHPHESLRSQGYNAIYITLAAGLLGISYLVRVPQLFKRSSAIMKTISRSRPSSILKIWLVETAKRGRDQASPYKYLWISAFKVLIAIYSPLKAMVTLYSSLLWEITWLLFALVWGTIRILKDRSGVAPDQEDVLPSSVRFDDDSWGFGQVLAISLLLVPCLSFFNTLHKDSTTKEHARDPSGQNHGQDLEQGAASNEMQLGTPLTNHPRSIPPEQTISIIDLNDLFWFRNLILLVYGLSIVFATYILILFPYERVSDIPDGASLGYLVLQLFIYLLFDLSMICAYCGLFILFHGLDTFLTPVGSIKPALHNGNRILWYYLVVIFMGGSIVFGLYALILDGNLFFFDWGY